MGGPWRKRARERKSFSRNRQSSDKPHRWRVSSRPVNLSFNDREAFQVIRSADTLYLAVKPLETALENSKLSRFQKMAIRRKEIIRALTQLARPESDRKTMMVQTERLGLKIYRADSPEYASLPRRIDLSAQPSPSYRATGLV